MNTRALIAEAAAMPTVHAVTPTHLVFYFNRGNAWVSVRVAGLAGRELLISEIAAYPHREGHGTSVMQTLCELADRHGVTLAILACPYGHAKMTQGKLVNWYEGFGFRGNYTAMKRKPTTQTHHQKVSVKEFNQWQA